MKAVHAVDIMRQNAGLTENAGLAQLGQQQEQQMGQQQDQATC